MRTLLAGIAALALIPVAVFADPGGSKGGGGPHGNGGGQGKGAAQAQQGDGHGQKMERTARGKTGGEHGNKHAAMRPEMSHPGPTTVQIKDDNRGNGNGKRARNAARDPEQGAEWRPAAAGNDRVAASRDRGGEDWRKFDRSGNSFGPLKGCPPGLAKKNNGCQPPGLARQNAAYAAPDWYRSRGFDTGGYRYFDGYLLRMNGSSVASYVPLLGGALGLGNAWPESLAPVAVPDYYRDYYGLGDPDGYRYYGDTIYRVDPQTSQIGSIAALLTGDRFSVGQRMPSGYDVYNVPSDYRDRYADGPDSAYRYADGSVYQVDPTTQVIQAVIQLLT